MKKSIIPILTFALLMLMIPLAFANQDQCSLGEVYVDGVGCVLPQYEITQKVTSTGATSVSSSTGGGLDAIRIDNPFAAPGQPVLVELTISNVGAQYPFDLIPLPPNQYAFLMTVDPVDDVLFKKEDGTYGRYAMSDVKWGSWFGSDWFARGSYFIKKAARDFKEVTGNDICKYVEVGDLFPKFAKQRFIYDNYEKEVEERHGKINDDNFYNEIDDKDIAEFFPAVYEWECIRSVDRQSFENDIKENYCEDSITMGCMAEYMNDNLGKLKTSSFVLLSTDVKEGECEYDEKSGYTYCGVGQDGICPPGSSNFCQGESSYTYEFVLLVPADAPALSPSEFEELINNGQIQGDFSQDAATGEKYNFGFTESPTCPDNEFSSGCHALNVRVQAVNKEGIDALFGDLIKGGALGCTLGAAGGIPGIVAGCLGGGTIGLVKGVMTWGNYEVIGAPIYEGQGTFFVVAPALKVAATFTLYLAILAGFTGVTILTRRRVVG